MELEGLKSNFFDWDLGGVVKVMVSLYLPINSISSQKPKYKQEKKNINEELY